MKMCSEEGCEREVLARGYCGRHYAAKKYHGEIKIIKKNIFWPSLKEKFDAHIEKLENGCWKWVGSFFKNGYPQIKEPKNGRNRKGNRVAYELYRGPIPEGMCALHKCDNRWCVNPDHLFLGTHQDNMDDMLLKGRQAKGERHGMCKLTESQMLQVRQEKDKSLGYFANHFNVTPQAIWRIRHNLTWSSFQ